MATASTSTPILRILNGSFLRSSGSNPIFKNLNLSIHPVTQAQVPRWSIIGNSKTALLQIIQGKHQCLPFNARTYPALSEKGKWPDSCIGLVEFTSTGGLGERVRGEYMSSRYESRREATDITLREWLRRTAQHMPMWTDNFDFGKEGTSSNARMSLDLVAKGLRLEKILEQPVSTLSNGQGRRARIAQALLREVDLLLLDEPFMGLDPPSISLLSTLLQQISAPHTTEVGLKTQVVLALRRQDTIPDWISHLIFAENNEIESIGERSEVVEQLERKGITLNTKKDRQSLLDKAYSVENSYENERSPSSSSVAANSTEILFEMNDINIAYWGKEVLKDFSWTIRRGERWGLFGPNGSGKTTVLSLLTSDHPLSYSLPILAFGRSRLPSPGQAGISLFDIQSRIGHSSPEIHQFFPKYRTLRQCVQSAFADTFLSKANMTAEAVALVKAIFEHFDVSKEQQETIFAELTLSTQRLALFMRAVVKKPDIIILDEAFSGMDAHVRQKCMQYLKQDGLSNEQALVCVSHVDEEIPEIVDKFVRLREAGSDGGPIFGER